MINGGFENPCLQWQRPEFAAESSVSQWNLILAEDIGMGLYMELEDTVAAFKTQPPIFLPKGTHLQASPSLRKVSTSSGSFSNRS